MVFGLITLWVVVTLVFILYFVVPHDPARLIAGRQASAATLAAVRRTLGFDQPVLWRYGNYLLRLVHGDLGTSYVHDEPVTEVIANALPVDISLAFGASILWLGMGLGIGMTAARRPRSLRDRLATVFALTGISFPTFVLGLLLLYVFFYEAHLNGFTFFPQSGYAPFTDGIWEWFTHLLLPWFTLAFVTAATYARLSRSTLLEALGEDYIRTARAKGLSENRVMYRHALRSALTPIVTQFGIDVAGVIGGVVLTEQVFGLNGLGKAAVFSITTQDLPVIIGITLVASFFVIAANIVVDVVYAFLDPRVRLA